LDLQRSFNPKVFFAQIKKLSLKEVNLFKITWLTFLNLQKVARIMQRAPVTWIFLMFTSHVAIL
jgi:hypothetical protein